MMKRKLWTLAGAVVFLAILGWAFYPKPFDVDVAEIHVGNFERTIEESGKTRLRDRYVISAPVAGKLARLTVREGDVVKAGQVVALLWPAPPPLLDERRLQEQREQVAAAEASVARANAGLQKSELVLSQAEADLRRQESLAARGFISPIQIENVRLTVQQRQREREVSAQEGNAARHQLAQLRIALQRVSGNEPLAKQAVAVTAPTSGKVVKLRQQSEAILAAGANLLDVGDPGAIEVIVELLTEDAAQIKLGAPAMLSNWGGPATLQARVRLVEPSAFTKVSALGVEEQRVNVVLDITSLPEAWQTMGDNYKVDVTIPVQSATKVTMVPVGCLFPRGSRSALFVLDRSRARIEEVELLARNGREAWIKTTLAAGTKVIAYPAASLKDGDRVNIIGEK
jgi:HlyD family secretion protein